ncbi:MAG: right-handed parallel beta-helix repeat-containing protein [Chitinivibrionales bacterium]
MGNKQIGLFLAGLLASNIASGIFAQQVTHTATYNNIGIEVAFSAATPTGSGIAVAMNDAQASEAWQQCHPLSRVASDRFAGSIFGLTAGTRYSIRLRSSLFAQDIIDTATTRSDSFAVPAGATYHVAKSGSDSYSGASLAQAFATLAHAVSIAQPGATILLHEGHYYESIDIPRSGTPSGPILIRNAPGEIAVLDGRDTAFRPIWSVYDATAGIYRASCTVQPDLAFYNGEHLFANPTLADLVSNTWNMLSGFFTDGSWLYVRLPHAGAPTGADTVQIPSATTAITCTGRQYIQFRGLEICYYGLADYSRGIYFDGASYNLVDSCYFHHSCIGVAIKRACLFNTVQHCRFTESPIDTWNWSAVKEGTGYYEAGGVVVYGSTSINEGNVIRNNHFYHMFDGSHLFSDDASGPTKNLDFCDNIVEFVNDDCIETDGAGSNCRIYNNTFRSFLTGVSVAPAAGGPTYIMRNTFSGWETHSGYVGYPVKFNVSSSLSIDWVYLYHNTCFTSVAGQPGFLFKEYSNWNNIISRNNIFAGTDNALESWPTQNPVDFDFDDLYTSASGKLINWANTNYPSVGAFSAATGQEPHGMSAAPGFVDAVGADFQLSGTSPLIDKGVVIPGVNDGYDGNGPDIGRFEYSANSVITGPKSNIVCRASILVITDNKNGRIVLRLPGDEKTPSASVTVRVYTLSGKLIWRGMVATATNRVVLDGTHFGSNRYVVRAFVDRSGTGNNSSFMLRN